MTSRTTSKLVRVLSAAQGKVIGRTKLQKTTFLMGVAGLLDAPFEFEYHHYGPYSEELTQDVRASQLFGNLKESHEYTAFGTPFSVFTLGEEALETVDPIASEFVAITNSAESIVLELAATAAFLKLEGINNPWEETAARKPEKATPTRMEEAKALYARLTAIKTPQTLPTL